MKQLQVIKEALNIATQKGAFNLDEAHIIKTNLEQAEGIFNDLTEKKQKLSDKAEWLEEELQRKEATIQTLKSNVDKVMALKDDPLQVFKDKAQEVKENVDKVMTDKRYKEGGLITKKPTKS